MSVNAFRRQSSTVEKSEHQVRVQTAVHLRLEHFRAAQLSKIAPRNG
jgi:hypothetical protein